MDKLVKINMKILATDKGQAERKGNAFAENFKARFNSANPDYPVVINLKKVAYIKVNEDLKGGESGFRAWWCTIAIVMEFALDIFDMRSNGEPKIHDNVKLQ